MHMRSLLYVVLLFAPRAAAAASFNTVYNFASGVGPAASDAGLVLDQNGLLYGVISGSQVLPSGAVFELDPTTGAFVTLFIFTGGPGGATPQQTLLFDRIGMLYGTTEFGGDANCQTGGCGTIFKLDPVTKQLTTLHAFGNFAVEGAYPASGGLAFGPGGALFGATSNGGSGGGGTVYSIATTGGALTVIASFATGPIGAMVAQSNGTLYGATASGGNANAGTLFSITPPSAGQTVWTVSTVYSFTGTSDGGYPYSGVVAGEGGTLFGSTESGGDSHGDGTAFRLVPSTGKVTIIRKFSADSGTSPFVPLAVGANYNVYGVAPAGGAPPRKCGGGCGTIYQLGTKGWQLSVLHEFTGHATGEHPQSPLVLDSNANIYGTALGGRNGAGTIFEMSP